jgi:hypothetical protein
MSSSTWIKDGAEPIIEEDLFLSRTNDDAAPYTWLDHHADSGSEPVADDLGFVDIDIDPVPTLYDVYERSFEVSQDQDQVDEALLSNADDDTVEIPALASAPDLDADTDASLNAEESGLEQHINNGAELADLHSGASQAPLRTLEDVFNLARYEPAQLQRVLVVLACTFQVIAVAALWKAIGDRVIAMALVPPVVYSSIGIAAYLLGMRYLRIHFAQVRVGDKDWLLCEQVMVAADNGVMLKARFGTAYLIWEQLLGVAQDNDYYYLLIEPSQGFKVPKQGVSDPVLKIKFEDLSSLTRAKALQGF